MIIAGLFSVLFEVGNFLLAPFRLLDIAISTSFFSTIMEYLNVIFYVLPIDNFIPIIAFLLGTMVMRILISLVKTLWQMIPFL